MKLISLRFHNAITESILLQQGSILIGERSKEFCGRVSTR